MKNKLHAKSRQTESFLRNKRCLFSKNIRSIAAFDICSRGIKLVILDSAQEPLITECLELFITEGQLFFKSEIDQLLQRIVVPLTADLLVAGVAGEQVMLRDLLVPELSRKELAAALKFQAEELMLVNSAEMVLDYQFLSERDRHLLLAVVSRELSSQLSGSFRAQGLVLNSLDLLVLAAGRCLLQFHPGLLEQTAAVIDIGASGTHLTVYSRGVIKYIKTLKVGGNSLNQAIAEHLLFDSEEAEHYKLQLTQDDVVAVKQEQADAAAGLQNIWNAVFEQGLTGSIAQSLKVYSERYPELPLDRIVLTGGGSNMAGLPYYLTAATGIATELARCAVPVAARLQEFLLTTEGYLKPEWTAAVGLAVGEYCFAQGKG